MKKVKLIFLIFVTGAVMFACSSDKKDLPVSSLLSLLENKQLIDYSTLSKKDKQIYKELLEIVSMNLKIHDEKLVFTMSKNEFISKGFPESLYDQFIQELNDSNTAMLQMDKTMRDHFFNNFPQKLENMKKQIADLK